MVSPWRGPSAAVRHSAGRGHASNCNGRGSAGYASMLPLQPRRRRSSASAYSHQRHRALRCQCEGPNCARLLLRTDVPAAIAAAGARLCGAWRGRGSPRCQTMSGSRGLTQQLSSRGATGPMAVGSARASPTRACISKFMHTRVDQSVVVRRCRPRRRCRSIKSLTIVAGLR